MVKEIKLEIQVLNNKVKINVVYGTHKEYDASYDDTKTQINLYVETKKKNKEALTKWKVIYYKERIIKTRLLHELTHALFIGNSDFDDLIRGHVQKSKVYKTNDVEDNYQEFLAYSMEYAPYLISLRDKAYSMILKKIKKDCKE